jgi:hypothetical protein
VNVGDKSEPALLCERGLPDELMATRALAIVVRNKRPVVVLDVGLNLIAYDFPDARWLDLAIELKDSGRVVELRDRARDGTQLVAPCFVHDARLDACKRDFANEPNPESFAERSPNGAESFRAYHDCRLERRPDRKVVVSRRATGSLSYPALIHDCAGGRVHLLQAQSEATTATDRASWRRSLVFFDKSCGQRGTWVWKGDRFARKP